MNRKELNEPIISVSGLRGIIGEQLTPLVAARYVAAMATTLPTGKIAVGRDGRASGAMIAQAVTASLIAHGFDVVDLGVASTPTVGVEVRGAAAVAGVQISASHNPRQYNGLKLFGPEGRVLSKALGEEILTAYRAGQTDWVGVDELGSATSIDHSYDRHCQHVLATVDVEAIRARKFRVLLDSNHGAGSLLGRQLLDQLGCDYQVLGGIPDGNFSHQPEPLAENLKDVAAQVRDGKFDVGFCQDPDADRLAVIDERGNYIGEELTLALCLLQVLPTQRGTVVTNCATSGLSRIIAEQYGSRVIQSAVGEANVADMMLAEKAIFGGEGNGGPIDPQVGYVRDSFVGMARILALLSSNRHTISQLVAELPSLSIFKDKIELSPEALPRLLDTLEAHMSDATSSRQDGLKLQWKDCWLLVRGSNTEPIVRLIAEAPTIEAARQLCARARDFVGMV